MPNLWKVDPNWLKEYLEDFINRFTANSLSLNPNLDLNDAKNISRLQDQVQAFKRLWIILFVEKRDLTEKDIIEIANTVNKNAMYISDGYRKIGNTFLDTDKPIANPKQIPKEMKNLLNDYQHVWQNLPILEKVAKFHMKFLQIHPFEDGNGRTSRMILSFQLLKEGYVPLIITEDKWKEYHEALYLDKEDVILKIFKEQYQKEWVRVNQMLESYSSKNEGPKLS